MFHELKEAKYLKVTQEASEIHSDLFWFSFHTSRKLLNSNSLYSVRMTEDVKKSGFLRPETGTQI